MEGCTLPELHDALYRRKTLLQAWSYRGVPVVFPTAESGIFLSPLAAQKSAAWPAERHNTSGAYPAGAPAFLRLCIYVFCAAPLKLRHSRRDRRTAAAPGGCRGRITSVRAAYCTARKKTPPAARGRKILCVKSRCAMRLCFGVAAVFCPHGVGRPEPRPWEHPPNLSMPPASAHCRKRVISHPRHPSWRWASPWGSSASRSAVAKGPGAS